MRAARPGASGSGAAAEWPAGPRLKFELFKRPWDLKLSILAESGSRLPSDNSKNKHERLFDFRNVNRAVLLLRLGSINSPTMDEFP
jgi:hypothetical protein